PPETASSIGRRGLPVCSRRFMAQRVEILEISTRGLFNNVTSWASPARINLERLPEAATRSIYAVNFPNSYRRLPSPASLCRLVISACAFRLYMAQATATNGREGD